MCGERHQPPCVSAVRAQSRVSRHRLRPRNPTPVMDSWLGPHACLAKDHVFLPQGASHRMRAHSRIVRYRLSRCNPTPVMDATLGATSAIAAHNSVTHGCAWKGAHKMSLACSRPSPRNSTLVMDSTLEATSTITAHASDSSLTHRWLDAWVCVERNQRPCEITVKGLPAPVTSLQSHSVMDSLPGAASAITVTAT